MSEMRKQLEEFWKQRLKETNKKVCPDCFKNFLDTMVEHVYDWIDLEDKFDEQGLNIKTT